MRVFAKHLLRVFLAFGLLVEVSAAKEATIQGTITDSTGKPIRGAMISASQGYKLVARFSQADGRYQVTLPSGTYNIEVKAYGFATNKRTRDMAESGDMDFTLTPQFDLSQLTSAQVEGLLPVNQQTKLIEAECIRCHGLTYLARRSEMTASQWVNFLPVMTIPRHWDDPYAPGEFAGENAPTDRAERIAALGSALEKYFGPDSQYFSPSKVLNASQFKYSPVTDAVLNSTIHEYQIPTRDVGAHSITTDTQGNAWFSELQEMGNKITKFNWETEEFTEYPLPFPASRPHTGAIAKNGIVWMPLAGAHQPAKLTSLDPETGRISTYDFPGNKARAHTIAIDIDGNVWITGSTLLKFDVKTHEFKEYKLPIPKGTEYSQNTWQAWDNLPGKPPKPIDQGVYDVKSDSKGMIWCTVQSVSVLIRVNPKTGEMKTFVPPDIPGITGAKGVQIDKDDNVWFAAFWGGRIGKFDQKSEKFTFYKPPTEFAMPYGLFINRKTGDIWYADVSGNFITRFDPKTAKFDEYPIPSAQASARFPAVDSNSGRVWFTEAMTDKIGYVEPGGTSSEEQKRQ